MLRNIIGAVTIATATLALTACASGAHPAGHPDAGPYPSSSHGSATTFPSAAPHPTTTPSPAPAAVLSTSPGDELLTFTGTARSGGSVAALSFTVHSPVAWNSQGGGSTLAALTAAGAHPGGMESDLLDPAWDADNAVSLAVVDYSARMSAGSWVAGRTIALDLGPWLSEVPLSTAGLQLDENGRWLLTAPGSGRIVVAFSNRTDAAAPSSPDPSTWGDQLEIYGFDVALSDAGGANSYQFSDCHLQLTALGERPAGVPEDWFTPNDTYCAAGIGD